jgi:hypothetical protein
MCGLLLRVHSVPNRSALHEDDRMVPVLPRDRRRETGDKSRFGLSRHLLETVCRQVMTFIDNQVTVVGDTIVDDTLPKALNDTTQSSQGPASPTPIRPI